MTQSAILIIVYGNPIRQDDAAGLRLADRFEQQLQSRGVAVKTVAVHQLVPELAVEIAETDAAAVVFVDTRDATGEPGQPEVDRRRLFANAQSSPGLGHQLSPEALLAYAELLYERRDLPAWLLTAPGVDFRLGEGLSETAGAAISRTGSVADDLLAELSTVAIATGSSPGLSQHNCT